jgi:hypothetical protein
MFPLRFNLCLTQLPVMDKYLLISYNVTYRRSEELRALTFRVKQSDRSLYNLGPLEF